MANNGNWIYGIVGFDDVMTVLGVPTTDVISLCVAENINKWSLRKPYSIPFGASRLRQLTDDDVNGCNGGFYIPSFNSLSEAYTEAKNNKDALWVYDKPTGGMASPYVIGDFLDYRHDSENWFKATVQRETAADLPAVIEWDDGGEMLVRSQDFDTLSSPKDLVAVIGGSTPQAIIKVCDLSLSGVNTEIKIPSGGLEDGTYTVIPMLVDSNDSVEAGAVAPQEAYNRWFPLPLPVYPTIKVDKSVIYLDYFDGITYDITGTVVWADDTHVSSLNAAISISRAQETVVARPLEFKAEIYIKGVYNGSSSYEDSLIATWSGTINNGQTVTKNVSASNFEILSKDGNVKLLLEITLTDSLFPDRDQSRTEDFDIY